MSVFIPVPKKGNVKECSNYRKIALISHASKVISKFSKPGVSNMWTENFQMFKLVYKRQRNQRSNCQHPLDHQKSKRVPEKHLYVLVAQSYPTLCNHIDHNPPDPSAHGILQAGTLEWVAISFSKRNYRKKESEVRKTSTSALLTMPKPLTVFS